MMSRPRPPGNRNLGNFGPGAWGGGKFATFA